MNMTASGKAREIDSAVDNWVSEYDDIIQADIELVEEAIRKAQERIAKVSTTP
jgi:hypothetical protein